MLILFNRKIVSVLVLCAFIRPAYAFDPISGSQAVAQLMEMLTTMKETLVEVTEQSELLNTLKDINEVRETTMETVQSTTGAFTSVYAELRAEFDALHGDIVNPFSDGISDFTQLRERLENDIHSLEEGNYKEFLKRKLSTVRKYEAVAAMEAVASENLQDASAYLSERDAANVSASSMTTLTLLALDEQKRKAAQDEANADAGFAMSNLMKNAGQIIVREAEE